jgi:hypothetical protein
MENEYREEVVSVSTSIGRVPFSLKTIIVD